MASSKGHQEQASTELAGNSSLKIILSCLSAGEVYGKSPKASGEQRASPAIFQTLKTENTNMLKEIPSEIVMDNGSVWHPKAYYYADSERGEIWSTYKNDWLKAGKNQDGYFKLKLMCEEGKHTFQVHRLIYEAFNGPIPQGLQVNHISEDKEDNRLINLNLMTPKENTNYGTGIDRRRTALLNHPNQSKRVYQYTTELELVDIHPSTNEAGRQGFIHTAVSACCNGKRKTHRGFIWSYTPLD